MPAGLMLLAFGLDLPDARGWLTFAWLTLLVALVLASWCLLALVLCLAMFRFADRRDG